MARPDGNKVFSLFMAARELPLPERFAFLDSEGLDEETRREIESLLAHDEAEDAWQEENLVGSRGLLKRLVDEPEFPEKIGDYRIEHLIGEGGMGRVYAARQKSPNRLVALKVIQPGRFSDASARRFQQESDLLGRMHHQGIAQVFEAGEAHIAGSIQPYVAMELIEGEELNVWAASRSLEERAKALALVCRAVAHAHHCGVIHRDLKPANVIVGADDQPKVLDFGIARAAERDLGQSDTATGQILGTLDYMSPEQLQGRAGDLSFSSDVFALGVMAFEIFSGQLPHDLQGKQLEEVIQIVCYRRAKSLRNTLPEAPRELEYVCAKALAKEPQLRYLSAEDLADDLDRWRTERPVLARPPSAFNSLRLFARRNRGLVGATLGVICLLLASVVVMAWLANEADKNAGLANAENEKSRRLSYRLALSSAAVAARNNDIDEAERLLRRAPSELKGWEFDHVRSRLDRSLASFESPSPQVRSSITAPVLIEEEGLVAMACVVKPGSGVPARIVISVWHLEDGSRAFDWQVPNSENFELSHRAPPVVCFTENGCVAVLDHEASTVSIYDARGNPRGGAFPIEESDSLTPGAELDVRRVGDVLVGRSPGAGAWFFLRDCGRDYSYVRLDESHDRVVVHGFGRNNLVLDLYDLKSGRRLRRFEGYPEIPVGIGFSADGKTLVAGVRDGSGFFSKIPEDARDDQEVQVLHEDRVRDVVFSPNGEVFATCGQDRTVKIWDHESAKLRGVFIGHHQEIIALCFIDDDRLISSDAAGNMKLWSLSTLEDGVLRAHELFIYTSAHSPDGRLLASGAWDGCIAFWDAETGSLVAKIPVMKSQSGYRAVLSLDFSPDGRWLALTCGSGVFNQHKLKIVDTLIGEIAADLGRVGARTAVTFLDEPRRLFINATGEARVFDASAEDPSLWRERRRLKAQGVCVASSDRAGLLALHVSGGSVLVCSTTPFRELFKIDVAGESIESIAISPDGTLLALGGRRDVHVFDLESREKIALLEGHIAEVFSLAFSPDGKRLVSGSDDRTARLWDTLEFQEIVQLRGHRDHVHSLSWSPDGRQLATGSGDYTLRLWDSLSVAQREDLRQRRRRKIGEFVAELEAQPREWFRGEALGKRIESLPPQERAYFQQAVLSFLTKKP